MKSRLRYRVKGDNTKFYAFGKQRMEVKCLKQIKILPENELKIVRSGLTS